MGRGIIQNPVDRIWKKDNCGGQVCKPDSPGDFCNALPLTNLLRTLKM
jgi:hypothetical protein